MKYVNFLDKKIDDCTKQNKSFPKLVWQYIQSGGTYNNSKKCTLHYYESIAKKMEKGSKERKISQKEYANQLLNLEGLGLDETLLRWAVKPETQNFDEKWKKEFLESYSDNKLSVTILNKSGKGSIYLDENHDLKSKSDESEVMKSFDFVIKGLDKKTEGFDGILTVDKTTKVRGGGQTNTKSEVIKTIHHLSKDPSKRNFLVLLDGNFWAKFVKENKNKHDNVLILTSDELVEYIKKNS